MFDLFNQVTAGQWLFLVLGMVSLKFVVETSIDLLNLSAIRKAPLVAPAGLEGQISAENVKQGLAYSRVGMRLSLCKRVAATIFLLWILFGGVLPWLSSMLAEISVTEKHQFVLFFVALGLLFFVFSLPWLWYRTFVLEERFGFNKQNLPSWLLDIAKTILIYVVLGVPVLYVAYWCLQVSGNWWWLSISLLLGCWQLIIVWLYPTVIAPLFNRLKPLPEGELRSRLEDLSQRAKFTCSGLFVMDASKRSSRLNAYFGGIFKPRIVLFDNLVKAVSAKQCEAVLAHEIGHYRLNHIKRFLLANVLELVITLFVLSLVFSAAQWATIFGFYQPSLAGEIAVVFLFRGTLFFLLGPIGAKRSRRFEYQADAYACRIMSDKISLREALLILTKQNFGNIYPHPVYNAYHYSHPSLKERLEAIDGLKLA